MKQKTTFTYTETEIRGNVKAYNQDMIREFLAVAANHKNAFHKIAVEKIDSLVNGKIDVNEFVVECDIMTLDANDNIRSLVAQHPGLCIPEVAEFLDNGGYDTTRHEYKLVDDVIVVIRLDNHLCEIVEACEMMF